MHIAREQIDPEADKVVRRLARHGYKAYLVGGCVRDLLLARKPKDFDVATSATPNEIKQLFRNCRIIGRRFRLAHIFFGSKIIETSTFRANPRQGQGEEEDGDELLIRRDNVFGNELEDAQRRDFTMNGLFYDVEADQVIDHVGGLADVEARVVATIGDPDIRFREDPVRILRAIKFAARLDFAIEPHTLAALIRHRGEIAKCAPPRVLEEVYRLLRGGAAGRSIELLCETGTAAILSPQLAHLYARARGVDGDDDAPTAELELPAAPTRARSRPIEHHGGAPAHGAHDDATPLDPEEAAWAAVWSGEAPLVPVDEDEEPALDEPADERLTPTVPPGAVAFVGDDAELAQRQAFARRALDQLDVLFAQDVETSNALLLAVLAAPFLHDDLLRPGLRPAEIVDLVEGLLGPLVAQLQIARKDAERARQILLVQRRFGPGRRRGGAGPRREVIDDAELLHDLMAAARGDGASEPAYWQRAQGASSATASEVGDDAPGKRRRRRRGGRRRRRPGEDDGDAALAGGGGDDEPEDAALAGDGVEPVSA